ncbi:MAG: hypothetical protein DCF30_03775 [Hyphomicrobiales bacterium]|nr:MAG: hypothetical protein DCF30_03775 [Hyphomicrobiales bacterium]
MRLIAGLILGFALGGCNQTSQTSETALPPQTAGQPAGSTAQLASASLSEPATIPPLYEPLIDTNRVNLAKLRKDLQECRGQAAPQEAAARRAAQQESTGAAMQAAGAIASFIPVPGFRQAHILAGASNAVQNVGAATSGNAAEVKERAMEDYVLVVNACMENRRYRLLRA